MTRGGLQEWEGPARGRNSKDSLRACPHKDKAGWHMQIHSKNFNICWGKKSKLNEKNHTYRNYAFLKILRNLPNDYQT